LDELIYILLLAIPAVLAVTVHEIAHGWVAWKLGDATAFEQGRVSLNPFRHVDPVGTILVPALLYFAGEFLFGSKLFFGWAKPVPVAWGMLRPKRLGLAMVAAAGPGANFMMLIGWVAMALVGHHILSDPGFLIYMCEAGIIFNVAIMVINLIPIPPLDGSRIITAVLPVRLALLFNRVETLGLALIVLLLVSGVLRQVIEPVFILTGRVLDVLGI